MEPPVSRCDYTFDEPVGSGIPSLLDGRYWCMGHIALGMSARRRRCPEDCPFDMGEWGAWRAVWSHVLDVPWNIVGPKYRRRWNAELLGAVGWSCD